MYYSLFGILYGWLEYSDKYIKLDEITSKYLTL